MKAKAATPKEKTKTKKAKTKSRKKKLDIKSFFVLNCEKIVLALVIPAALYVAYLGTRYEPLKWQPDELQRISQEADQHIKSNVRKAVDEGVVIFPYDTYAEWIKRDVRPDLYRTEIQWLPPLFPEKNKRPGLEQKQLYTVRDLKARAGLGALSVNPLGRSGAGLNPMSGTETGTGQERIGKRWAVVTGLIPIKDQLNIYVEAYSSSVYPDPLRDMPLYWLYEVERAEILPGVSDEELQWAKIDFIPTFRKDTNTWGTFSMDPVDPNYLAPTMPGSFPMAYPLPPVERPFGEEVVHPPVIPMLTESQIKAMKEVEKYQERMDQLINDIREEDYLEQDPFGGATGMGGGGMPSGMGMGGEMGGGMEGGMMGRPGGMGGGNVGGNVTSTRRLRQAMEASEEIKNIEVTDYLYRFFDFNVEPGKTYRYRVRLYLANPNFQLPPNVLVDEDLAKNRHVVTEYSEPSNRVTIPLESRILATTVNASPPRTPWIEPSANVMAVHFEVEDGSEWCVDLDRIFRGTTLNVPSKQGTNYREELKTRTGGMMGMEGGMPPAASRRQPTGRRPVRGGAASKLPDMSKKTVEVRSDVSVVDMLGGQTMKNNLRSPGKILVLEPSGNLVIRDVADDMVEVEQLKHPVAAGGMMGGMDGGMYPGMGAEY